MKVSDLADGETCRQYLTCDDGGASRILLSGAKLT